MSGRRVKHEGRSAVHGFKAHVGADADTALVEEIAVTPANINDGKAGPDALPDNPGDVYADSAYRGDHFGNAVIARGGRAAIHSLATLQSLTFPGVRSRTHGRPFSSQTA